MITAPYNFVPLNKEVFYPTWDKDVSQDIPFEDGESGVIDVTIVSKSPIFIRNHYEEGDEYAKNKKGDKVSIEFCHHKLNGAKQYYIPGSSIKGMTRSVLEILSFSKIKFMNDATLNVRDMSNQKLLVGAGKKCGFLVKTETGFALEDCGKPRSISFSEVEKATGTNVRRMNTAKEKYKAIGMVDIAVRKEKKIMTNFKGDKIPKDIALFDPNSNVQARLVLTGAINDKKNEFVFIKNNQTIILDEASVMHRFKKAYFHEGSEDGQFWEKQFKKDMPIPVFYATDKTGAVQNIGLTQLFKLAYNKTLFEAAKQNTKEDRYDLVECMFGAVEGEKALKGRIQFSHLKSTHETYEKVKSEILGEPNPTYFPNYIRQTNVKNGKVIAYKTLMDSNAEIAGWKRYPLHQSIVATQGGNDNEDIRSKFKPLGTDSTFKGKIRFHNLKKVEIGALLSALTFHGQEAKHMHNLGMAKALGYGKISVELTLNDSLLYSKGEYLSSFEKVITNEISNWKNTPQVKELFSMSRTVCRANKDLTYQLLENPNPKYFNHKKRPEKNDFTGAKKVKEYLLPHSSATTRENVSSTQTHVPSKKVPTSNNVKSYTMDEIAAVVPTTVQEVIDFSVGLHFGTLTPSKILKEPQAKDLIKKMQGTGTSPVQTVTSSHDGISKSKLRKAISAYWQREFNTSYHRTQVREFLSGKGFDMTPEDQRAMYEGKEDDAAFGELCRSIFSFEFTEVSEEKKQSLYEKLA